MSYKPTGTNIIKYSGTCGSPLYRMYWNYKYPLNMTTKYSTHNMGVLLHHYPNHFVMMSFMCHHLKRNSNLSALEAITVEVKREDLNKLFNRRKCKEWINEMIDGKLIKRVKDSQKCLSFYINPIFMNTLTQQQALEYAELPEKPFPSSSEEYSAFL